MALLGSDFNPAVPADTDFLANAASVIRDLKTRLQGFVETNQNGDTAAFLPGVIPSTALAASGVAAGSYNNVTVNAGGIVTGASTQNYPSSTSSPNASITASIASGVLSLDLALGIPFHATATLTSVAAGTAVTLVADTMVPVGKKCYLTSFFGTVSGASAWGGTATSVYVQDSNSTPATFVTVPVASMTANAFLGLWSTVTAGTALSLGTGGTAGHGLVLVANANGTGSNFVVTVAGWIK